MGHWAPFGTTRHRYPPSTNGRLAKRQLRQRALAYSQIQLQLYPIRFS